MEQNSHRVCAFALTASMIAAVTAPSALAENQWEVTAKASTLGIGVELKRGLGESVAVRGAFNTFTYGVDDEYSDVSYDGDLKLSSGGAFLDFHPGGGLFRITAGLLINDNSLDLDAEPTGGTYEFNGVEYSAAQIGSARGKADFDSVAPYLGIGVGSAPDGRRGVTFSADLGVLFQGSPSFDLRVNCAASVPAPVCTQIQADAEAERKQFEDDADNFEYYPVLSIGVGYRF